MQGFMMSLLLCSGTMSILALLYMAVTPLLDKRYAQKGCYYAWLILVLGLIIPVRPQFSHSLVRIAATEATALSSPIINGNTILAPVGIRGWQIAAAVWLLGMLAFLIYQAVKHYRWHRLILRWSVIVSDQRQLAILSDLKAELAIAGRIGLCRCECIASPMLVGFLKPRILLPKQNFTTAELGFILKHELIHYKRKDLWYKSLVLLATAIHWFNPVVYFMASVIEKQCEASCDAEVVRNLDGEARLRYSQAILGVVKHHAKLKPTLSTCFYGGGKNMKQRISSIMDTSKKRAGIAVICAVLLLTLGTGIAFSQQDTSSNVPSAASGYTVSYTNANPETGEFWVENVTGEEWAAILEQFSQGENPLSETPAQRMQEAIVRSRMP